MGELARREDVWDGVREGAGGRRGCSGGSVSVMRSQVSSEADWTLSCLCAGRAWLYGRSGSGQRAGMRGGTGSHVCEGGGVVGGAVDDLDGLWLVSTEELLHRSRRRGGREGSWCTMNRCRGCVPDCQDRVRPHVARIGTGTASARAPPALHGATTTAFVHANTRSKLHSVHGSRPVCTFTTDKPAVVSLFFSRCLAACL